VTDVVFTLNMSRSADYNAHALADTAYLLAVYLILPYRFMLQFISAVIFTAGNILIVVYFKSS
jgi:hypothetical protein